MSNVTGQSVYDYLRSIGIEATNIGVYGGDFRVSTKLSTSELKERLTLNGFRDVEIVRTVQGSEFYIWTVYVTNRIKDQNV